jgi:pimeloyl-ACP methyl ester carboxylesterase
MRRRHRSFFAALAALLATLPVLAEPPVLEPCRLEAGPGMPTIGAQCGRLAVPENPAEPGGATIELFVARVPALTATPQPDALTVIAGGPGQASTDFYAAYRGAFARVRRERDVLLVDQRGTGRSNRLQCPELLAAEELAAPAEELVPATRECLAALPGDPRFYTTSVAVEDLERVRAAFGYPALNVYGASYGTRVAQHYVRRYPGRTRTAILDGVVPPGLTLGPDIPLLAERALDAAFARCSRDPACRERFPAPARQLEELLARLAARPAPVTLPDPLTGAPTEGELSADQVRLAVRLLLYGPQQTALLPFFIDEAASGRPAPLKAQADMVMSSLTDALAYGMHNAVMCTEDVPFWRPGDIDREALAATFLGAEQVEMLQEMCSVWPPGVIDQDLRASLESDVPVLLLSGEYDPITPPEYAERAAEGLSAALHVVAPGQSHGVALAGCLPRLIGEFVDQASVEALDVSCVGDLGPTPFFLDYTGPGP